MTKVSGFLVDWYFQIQVDISDYRETLQRGIVVQPAHLKSSMSPFQKLLLIYNWPNISLVEARVTADTVVTSKLIINNAENITLWSNRGTFPSWRLIGPHCDPSNVTQRIKTYDWLKIRLVLLISPNVKSHRITPGSPSKTQWGSLRTTCHPCWLEKGHDLE